MGCCNHGNTCSPLKPSLPSRDQSVAANASSHPSLSLSLHHLPTSHLHSASSCSHFMASYFLSTRVKKKCFFFSTTSSSIVTETQQHLSITVWVHQLIIHPLLLHRSLQLITCSTTSCSHEDTITHSTAFLSLVWTTHVVFLVLTHRIWGSSLKISLITRFQTRLKILVFLFQFCFCNSEFCLF